MELDQAQEILQVSWIDRKQFRPPNTWLALITRGVPWLALQAGGQCLPADSALTAGELVPPLPTNLFLPMGMDLGIARLCVHKHTSQNETQKWS